MFKVYRPKHMRLEGDSSFKERLRRLLSNRRRNIAALGIGVTLAAALGLPVDAQALENNMSDTSTQTEHTYFLDNETTDDYSFSFDQSDINEAVAQSQAITDGTASANEETNTTDTTSTASTEVADEATQTATNSAAVLTAAEDTATDISNEATDEQTTNDVVAAEDSKEAEAASESAIATYASTEESTTTENTTEDSKEAEAASESAIATYASTEGSTTTENTTEDSKEAETASNSAIATYASTEGSTAESTVEDSSNEIEADEATQTVTNASTLASSVDTSFNYQIVESDGTLIVVGEISEDELSQLIEDLTQQYGKEIVDSSLIFDSSSIEVGGTVKLGDTGYVATKEDDGSITISLASTLTNSELGIPDNYVSAEFDIIGSDEYFVAVDSDGHSYIGLGGVGLSNSQLQELLSSLQDAGIIESGSDYSVFVLPSELTEEEKADGITKVAQVDDLYFAITADSMVVFAEDAENLETLQTTYQVLKSTQLAENYETSNDPTAEPGDKADVDEPTVEVDEPEPTVEDDEPETTVEEAEPEPEPAVEEDEPKQEITAEEEAVQENVVTTSDIPQTGDSASLASTAAALVGGAGLIGAGAATRKKAKGKAEDKKENEKVGDDPNQKATTYEDLEKLAKTQAINPHDYDDDLEMFAKAWTLSKDQNVDAVEKSQGKVR